MRQLFRKYEENVEMVDP